MSNTKPSITVVLGLPKPQSTAALIVRLNAIVDAMTAAVTVFPVPTPTLSQVKSDLVALTSAEAALKNRLGTRVARDAAKAVVVSDAHGLHNYVQSVVNANPGQAETIAQEASMSIRKPGARHTSDLAVKQTVSGAVHVIAKATQGAKAHEWQYSTDGGKTWIDAPSTTKSSTVISGLQPGANVAYRVRVLTKSGHSDWSQPVAAVVQ